MNPEHLDHRSNHSTRREFLVGAVAGSVGIGATSFLDQPLAAALLDTERRKRAHRRRRVIFNNDGDDIWANGANTVEKFLARRHTPLLATHVDSIFYCTTQSFNHFTHDTKVAEVFSAKTGQFANNNLGNFLKKETDGLRMSSEFAHKHRIESFWTLRMNDIHDAWTAQFRPKWKSEDPTRIMSTLEAARIFNDRRRLWGLVDFEHPVVEPRLLAIIEEVLTNYEIDGIELDFLRAPIYFRTAFNGQPVTQRQVDVLTKIVRGVRKLVLQKSQEKKKPILLAARVPSTKQLCRKIGIDIAGWLKSGLLDLMALGGGYITFDVPVKELIELGHQHDVPVYPCLSLSGLMNRPPRGNSSKQQPAAWFGAASRLWNDGADGIYTFNLFPDNDRPFSREILSAIGSIEKLRTKEIKYAISDAGWWMPSHYWAKDAADFSRALPMALEPNKFERTSLFVPEDMRGTGFDVTAELRVDFTGLNADSTPQVLFDSANFGMRKDGKQVAGIRRFVCPVPIEAIRQGPNRVMVKTAAKGAKLAGAELWIKR